MPLERALPRDLGSRLEGLGDAIASSSPDVLFAYLFGSAATGALTPRSDIDIAVYAVPAADGLAVRLAVARAVARQMRTDAVDVVLLNTAPLSLAGRVLKTRCVLLDRDPFARHQYESRTARLFQDFGSESTAFSPSGAPMLDRDLVLRRLAMLDTYFEQLAPFRALDERADRDDWKTQRIVERTLYLAIETCMDVADHIMADHRLRVPETGAESFEILAEANLLPVDLGAALASMVGFRNILVHDYARLDPAIVTRVLQHDVNDLVRFRDVVHALV